MQFRNVLAAVCSTALAACSSFDVRQPVQGSVITLPATVPVDMIGKPQILGNVEVKVVNAAGTTDVSNQVARGSATQFSGALNLQPGQYKVFVAADVECSYCTGSKYRPDETRSICVTTAGTGGGPFKTAFAKGDNQSWAAIVKDVASFAQDAATPVTRWGFNRLGGITSDSGLLESKQFPCHCMRSMVDSQNAQIGLVACDRDDPLQRWQGLRIGPVVNSKAFYRFQNMGRGVSDACLTEGANGQLIQKGCNDTDNQLWAVQSSASGQFESGTNPWF